MAKGGALNMFAKKLLLGLDFDVRTDLQLIARQTTNNHLNNSVQANDDGPDSIEYEDIPEAHSVQYSAEDGSDEDDSDAKS